MQDLETVLRQYAWNLAYAHHLTDDVPDDLWARTGGAGHENHPAWTLGHLVTGSALVAADLGAEARLPDGWAELFERLGPKDPWRGDVDEGVYPPRRVVMGELERVDALV